MSGEGAAVPAETTVNGVPNVTVPTETVAKTPWYATFFAWFKKTAKKVFEIVMTGVSAGVSEFLNNPENQALAVAAVKAAIDRGLRGEDAWVTARDALVAQLKESGMEASNTVIDTILQNAYCVTKYSVAAGAEK